MQPHKQSDSESVMSVQQIKTLHSKLLHIYTLVAVWTGCEEMNLLWHEPAQRVSDGSHSARRQGVIWRELRWVRCPGNTCTWHGRRQAACKTKRQSKYFFNLRKQNESFCLALWYSNLSGWGQSQTNKLTKRPYRRSKYAPNTNSSVKICLSTLFPFHTSLLCPAH